MPKSFEERKVSKVTRASSQKSKLKSVSKHQKEDSKTVDYADEIFKMIEGM